MSDYTCKESTIKDIERLEFLVLSGLDKECEGVMGGYNPSSFLRGLSYGLERANEIISNQPTLDETEIIRKAFERVLTRLEEASFPRNMGDFTELVVLKDRAIEILKEECGISEQTRRNPKCIRINKRS